MGDPAKAPGSAPLPGLDALVPRLRAACEAATGLELLLLFGSRARGEERPGSDWDFGYLATEAFDPLDLQAILVTALGTEHVDLVDLGRAGAVLRFSAARDGRLIVERERGAFDAFRLEAADFWCDAGPIIRKAQRDYVAGLGR